MVGKQPSGHIDVIILQAERDDSPVLGGFFDLFDEEAGTSARLEFRAKVKIIGEDTVCTFSRLRTPLTREDFSELGPFEDDAHLLFAAALRTTLNTLGEGLIRQQIMAARMASDRTVDRPLREEDIGIKVRFAFEPKEANLEHVLATLTGQRGLFGFAASGQA